MIHFVVTGEHRYTMQRMLSGGYGKLPFHAAQVNYANLFGAESIPTGTWIFQDIERLFPWELMRAAMIASRLEQRGARVLNHPARACARYELQRRLYTSGINAFETFRGDEMRMPTRWPVFLRLDHNHQSPNPTLYQNEEELRAGLEKYNRQHAIPLSQLLIVEYCSEQAADGLWRKYAAYRIGDEIIHHHIIRQDSWVAKEGNPDMVIDAQGIEDMRFQERDYIHSEGDPHGTLPAFKLGSLEFGRMDYNLVGGKLQVYEINTNPVIGEAKPEGDKYPALPRDKLHRHANLKIIQALKRLDTRPAAQIDIRKINASRVRP